MAVNTVRGVVNFGPRLTKNIASKVKSLPLKVASNPETSKILSLLKTKAKQAKDITATTLSKVKLASKTIPLKLKESLKGIKIVPDAYHVPTYHNVEGPSKIPYQPATYQPSFDHFRMVPEGWPSQNNENVRMIETKFKRDFENLQDIPDVLAQNMENLKHNLDHFSRRIPNQMRENIRNINIPDGLKPNQENTERLQHRLLATVVNGVDDAKTFGGKLSDSIKYADRIPIKENMANTEALLRTIPDQVTEDLENMRNIPHHLRQNLESYKSIPYHFTKSLENMKSIPHLFWTKLGRTDLANSAVGQQRIRKERTQEKKRLVPSKEDRKMEEFFKKIIYAYLVENGA